ncbi:hypothetical protein [Erythrobacter sp. HKB08]|uniref:TolB family protein n=1 Tax=Erythrobacter sp. HKB08 TaxID=2502843 RepID=UPI0013E8C061|nr:hypothetical protein [Erythrobacter sp. HKB08]
MDLHEGGYPMSAEAIRLTNPSARLMARTPRDRNMFFGFHDLCPWSPDGSELLLLSLPTGTCDMVDTTRPATIAAWNPDTGATRDLAETECWNFQQAARQQWLPGDTGQFVFNRASESGQCEGVVCTSDGAEARRLERGVYSIVPDGTWAITQDFALLAKLWPAYGYASLASEDYRPEPSETGLWRVDMASGKARMLVSLQDVLASWQGSGEGHFLSHPSISPDGSRLVFLHRFFPADGGLYTRLMGCGADGSGLHVLGDEKVSHFDWLDNDRLVVWARFSGGGLAKVRAAGGLNLPVVKPLLSLARKMTGRWKKRVLSESFFTVTFGNTQPRRRFGWPALDEDGHPMVARTHGWMVNDTYPDASGQLTLMLYDLQHQSRVDIAAMHHGVTSDDSDAKCDLHPRWNRAETMVAVDHCEDGRRGVALFDVSHIVGAGA